GGESSVSPMVRVERSWLRVGTYAAWESNARDSSSRVDVGASVRPFTWIGANAAVGNVSSSAAGVPAVSDARAAIELRVRRHSLTLGAIALGEVRVPGLFVFDSTFGPELSPQSMGTQVRVAGPLRGPFSYEWTAIQWDTDAPYRPET